jgi:DNA polymerase III epsilon subunit-like protein
MNRKHISVMQPAFVDVETSGLEPTIHDIVEIAIIHPERGEWSSKVRLDSGAVVQQRALEVNGYRESEWSSAPTLEAIADDICHMLNEVIIVAHNVAFDMAFIEYALRRRGKSTTNVSRYRMDTMMLAYEHLVPQGLSRLNLDAICDFLGISNEGNHRALQDARRCKMVYEKLMRSPIQLQMFSKG